MHLTTIPRQDTIFLKIFENPWDKC